MALYKVPRSIIEASLAELAEIFHWVRERESPEDPITVLIGGGRFTVTVHGTDPSILIS